MGGPAPPSPAATVCFVFVYVGCVSRQPTDVVQLERDGGRKEPVSSDLILAH